MRFVLPRIGKRPLARQGLNILVEVVAKHLRGRVVVGQGLEALDVHPRRLKPHQQVEDHSVVAFKRGLDCERQPLIEPRVEERFDDPFFLLSYLFDPILLHIRHPL